MLMMMMMMMMMIVVVEGNVFGDDGLPHKLQVSVNNVTSSSISCCSEIPICVKISLLDQLSSEVPILMHMLATIAIQ